MKEGNKVNSRLIALASKVSFLDKVFVFGFADIIDRHYFGW